MERLEDCSVLHALYKEASTRRHTADVKEVLLLRLNMAFANGIDCAGRAGVRERSVHGYL